MTTKAQVRANRRNAQKSTGPRTAEGKATVSQNAVKHGFLSRLDVIRGEEQAEFDLFREQMLGEWAPDGTMETMLVERITSLSWRLKRAERMQSEAFEALLTPDTSSLAVRLAQSLRPKRSQEEQNAEDELAFGRAVVKDFSHGRVLDRLCMYERRMEHSLYRTMAELQRLRLMPEVEGSTPVGSGPGTVGAGFKPARAASQETPDSVTTNEGGGQRPTHEETPDGVTTNEVGRGRSTHEEPGHHSSVPSFQHSSAGPAGAGGPAAEKSCKTKPISSGPSDGQAIDNKEVTEISLRNATGETKPISEAGVAAAALDLRAKN
jgi:hypothetical protein